MSSQLGSSVFAVGDKFYCVWDWDLRKENLSYLESLDTDYYTYVVRSHAEALEGDDDQRAAIALRNAYHHGLETLFALLLASFQAPFSVFGWILRYRTGQLRNLVRKVHRGGALLPMPLNIDCLTWEKASAAINQHSYEEEGRRRRTQERFAEVWTRFAHDFLDDYHIKEYNSLKHGFRARPGGFGLRIGLEEKLGEAPPPEQMQWVSASEFGSSFLVDEPIKDAEDKGTSPHFQVRQYSLNWDPEILARRLQLISMSLANIVSTVKIWNGVDRTTVKYWRPEADEAFDEALKVSGGASAFSLSRDVREEFIERLSEDELRDLTLGDDPDEKDKTQKNP